MEIKAVWISEKRVGCEYFALKKEEDRWIAEGTILFLEDQDHACHAVYTVEVDKGWRTKKLEVTVNHTASLEIHADGKGNWFDEAGEPLDELQGAIDIDISATPFSNSLPINRLEWETHQVEHFQMVYISLPTLEIKKVPQSYEYVIQNHNLRYFSYRSKNYETVIAVDSDGLVVEYPGLFTRKL